MNKRKIQLLVFCVNEKSDSFSEKYIEFKKRLDSNPEFHVEDKNNKSDNTYYEAILIWFTDSYLKQLETLTEQKQTQGRRSTGRLGRRFLGNQPKSWSDIFDTTQQEYPSLPIVTVFDDVKDSRLTQLYTNHVLQSGGYPFATHFNHDVLIGYIQAAAIGTRQQRILKRFREQTADSESMKEVGRYALNALKDLTRWGKATIALVSDLKQIKENFSVPITIVDFPETEVNAPYYIRSLLIYDGYGKEDSSYNLLKPLDEDAFMKKIILDGEPVIYPDLERYPPEGWEKHHRETKDTKSWIGLPLYDGNEPIAVITLENRYENFEHVDRRMLKIFADQAASAFRRAQLREGQKRLQEASQAVASNVELNRTFFEIAQYANELTSSTYSYIVRPQYEGGEMKLKFVAAWPRKFLADLQAEVDFPKTPEIKTNKGTGFTHYVYEKRKALLINNVKNIKDKEFARTYYQYRSETHTEFVYPIIGRDKKEVLAVLNLEHEAPYAFTVEELHLVEGLANSIAITIEKNTYIDANSKRQQQLLLLQSASESMATDLNPEKVIQTVAEHTKKAFGASVLVLVPTVEKLSTRQVNGKVHPFDRDRYFTEPINLKNDIEIRNNGKSMEVYRTGKAQYFENLKEANLEHFDLNSKLLDGEHTRAAICLPLRTTTKFVGVLWLHFDEPRNFTRDEKEVYEAYAKQVALAYDNATYLQKLAKVTSEYTLQFQEQYVVVARQAQRNHMVSIGVSIIGFIVVVVCVVIAVQTGDRLVALVSSFAALLSVVLQAASQLIFSHAQRSYNRMDNYHKELFEVGSWFILQKTIEDLNVEDRDEIRKKLVDEVSPYWLKNRMMLNNSTQSQPGNDSDREASSNNNEGANPGIIE